MYEGSIWSRIPIAEKLVLETSQCRGRTDRDHQTYYLAIEPSNSGLFFGVLRYGNDNPRVREYEDIIS